MMAVNLLPWRERARTRRRRLFALGLTLAATVTVIVAVFAHLRLDAQLARVKAAKAKVAAEVAMLEVRAREAADLAGRHAIARTRLDALQRLRSARIQSSSLLGDLGRTVPTGLRFTRVARQGQTVTVNGLAKTQLAVSRFMRNLAAATRLGAPRLKRIGEEADGTFAFELTFDTGIQDEPGF